MGIMSQKELATEGAERINSFLDQQEEDTTVQEEDALNTEFDEEGEYLEGLQDKYLVTGSDGQEWSDTPYLDEGLKDPMAEVAMFTPIVGDAIEATIAAQEAMEGNWWSSAANLAGVVPIAGPTIKKAMKKYKAPKKTALGYKLFRTDPDQPGELFPLFVDGKSAVPIGEWVTSADVYNFTAANGRKYVPATTGDSIPIPNDTVRKELLDNGFSKKPNNKAIKAVAYRPGFHAGDTPSSQHIGGQSTGAKKPDHRQPNQVWAEVEMPDDVDWQTIANANATRNKNGSIQARTAEVTEGIPHGGFYRYKTNANMVGNWMIGGAVKVNRVLSDIEVKKINDKAGVSDLPRLKPRADGGDSVPKDTGNIPKFNQGGLVDEEMEALGMGTPDGYTISGGLPKAVAPERGGSSPTFDPSLWDTVSDKFSTAGKVMGEEASDFLSEVGSEANELISSGYVAASMLGSDLLDWGRDTYTSGQDSDAVEASVQEPQAPAEVTPIVSNVAAVETPTTADVTLTGWSNLAGLESVELHVDHSGVVTMGRGVVADGGVTLNGVDINVKEGHGLTSTSDLAKVDTSKAYKTVNGTKYKREDYTSDELFSKAIYSAFYASAKDKVSGFDNLDDLGKEVVIDIGYNMGEGAFNYDDVATLVTELQKDKDKQTIDNLTQFTQNFSSENVGNTRGLLRRRAVGANKVLSSEDQIAYIEQTKEANGKTTFYMKREDGTTVRSWLKNTAVDAPAGEPIITIDGRSRATYGKPKHAYVDLTDWANAIT